MRKIVSTKNIKINGSPISNIRYADDTVLMADSTQGLQQLLISLKSESEERGLTINTTKTKIMVLSTNAEIPYNNIFLEGEKLDQLDQSAYPGADPEKS